MHRLAPYYPGWRDGGGKEDDSIEEGEAVKEGAMKEGKANGGVDEAVRAKA